MVKQNVTWWRVTYTVAEIAFGVIAGASLIGTGILLFKGKKED